MILLLLISYNFITNKAYYDNKRNGNIIWTKKYTESGIKINGQAVEVGINED